jgi:hypothetical protein
MATSVLATGADFLLVCNRDSHKTPHEYVHGAALDQHAVTEAKPGKRSLTYRYRCMEGVALRHGKDAMNVNRLGVGLLEAEGKAPCDGAWVTSLPLAAGHAVEIAACARAPGKIENESFKVLKNGRYNLARNFAHGKKNLAPILAAMNLSAFALHRARHCLERLCQPAREAIATRARWFPDIRAIWTKVVFPSWTSLTITPHSGKTPPIWNFGRVIGPEIRERDLCLA